MVPFFTAIVLFWQRRRVVPLLRRAWAALREQQSDAGEGGKRVRASALGRRALAAGWRAVDTQANATRMTRLVAWMRSLASSGEVAHASSTRGPAV